MKGHIKHCQVKRYTPKPPWANRNLWLLYYYITEDPCLEVFEQTQLQQQIIPFFFSEFCKPMVVLLDSNRFNNLIHEPLLLPTFHISPTLSPATSALLKWLLQSSDCLPHIITFLWNFPSQPLYSMWCSKVPAHLETIFSLPEQFTKWQEYLICHLWEGEKGWELLKGGVKA